MALAPACEIGAAAMAGVTAIAASVAAPIPDAMRRAERMEFLPRKSEKGPAVTACPHAHSTVGEAGGYVSAAPR